MLLRKCKANVYSGLAIIEFVPTDRSSSHSSFNDSSTWWSGFFYPSVAQRKLLIEGFVHRNGLLVDEMFELKVFVHGNGFLVDGMFKLKVLSTEMAFWWMVFLDGRMAFKNSTKSIACHANYPELYEIIYFQMKKIFIII